MAEHDIHIEKIRKEMRSEGADALLVTSNVNLYYCFGQVVMGYYYIPIEGQPLLFIRRPAGLESDNIIYVRKQEQITDILKERGIKPPQSIMLEGDRLSHTEWMRYAAIFHPAKPMNGTPAIQRARSI